MDIYRMWEVCGPLRWPLLACSVLALAIALERVVLFLWQGSSYPRFLRRLQQAVRTGVPEAREFLREQRSPLARVAEVYLQHEQSPDALRQEVVAREASMRLNHLERRTHWLSVIGSISPMLGLLGTVLGLVEAFRQVENLSGQVQPGDLAGGIWEALITTVFGLFIAIPTLAVYHFLEHRIGAVQLQMQWLVASLNEWYGHALVPAERATAPAEQMPEDVAISAGELQRYSGSREHVSC
jgi:biopolymer transport protein ExbB